MTEDFYNNVNNINYNIVLHDNAFVSQIFEVKKIIIKDLIVSAYFYVKSMQFLV